jgi:hypothetical protein
LILSPDHHVERCNPAFGRLSGQPVSQIIGKPHTDVIRWAELETGVTLEQAEVGGWPLTPNATLYVEGDMERPAMTPLPIGITYAPLLSQDGQLINIVATVRDISRFREADELKSTFISVISHELKTPGIDQGLSAPFVEDATWDRNVVRERLAVIEDGLMINGTIENC